MSSFFGMEGGPIRDGSSRSSAAAFTAFTSSASRPTLPELNPDEGIWKLAKQKLANGCPSDISDLTHSLVRALDSIRKNRKNLRACITHSALPSFLHSSLHS
jgi:hypothetical protein